MYSRAMRKIVRRHSIRLIALLLSLVGLSAVSAYLGYQVGGRVGFVQGFAAGSWSSDTTNAAITTFALKKLHQADIAAATGFLEPQVDSGLLSYWAYSLSGDSEFDRSAVVAKSHRTIQKVAEYRRQHPSGSKYESVRESINEALALAAKHQYSAAQQGAAAAERQ